ncbi:O-antigen ligase family protein [Olivibacter sitiensis]|uniref:O-antigen ligase family protein n=1 Tax=Olivibacter sitiensis TaxID=376470 RepID=UPI000401060E|nr:O-antigen ligase family protein [Olivibacter sitiensis]
MVREKTIWKHSIAANKIGEWLFCLCLVTIFLPLKIYPLVFLVAGLFFLWQTGIWSKTNWYWPLGIFAGYTLVRFALDYGGQKVLLEGEIKLLVNLFFLASATHWLYNRDNRELLTLVNRSLHVVLLLCFVQLWIYHQAWDYKLVFGGASSGETSRLYRYRLFFWGLPDKNMFGARIALLGFAYILIPFVKERKIVLWRILAIGLLAFLSLSRTPIVALLIGVFLLGCFYLPKKARLILIVLMALAVPVVVVKLLRVDSITASNDGMGVRLTYWRAFFSHWNEISIWGNGLNAGGPFLAKYARYYHGEPHVHNTFMTCYMDFGWIGLGSYLAFLILFFRDIYLVSSSMKWMWLVLAPLLAIMMILYSGYDNDVVCYLALATLLTTQYRSYVLSPS